MLQNKSSDITLIVPAAGKSSRYPGSKPKWMLTHPDGMLMIEKVLNDFKYEKYKKTYITILKNHCTDFEADLVLRQSFGNTIELLVLDNPTDSCPETIYETIKKGNIEGRIAIKDTDCLVVPEQVPSENFIVGMTIDENSNVEKLQNKSFIVKNENNIVQDIVEKRIVSNNICLGVYCLLAKDFVEAYNEINASRIFFKKTEIYVSHIISHLILNSDKLFQCVQAVKYEDWGTIKEWEKEKQKYNTYIFNIDGIAITKREKYGSKNWSNTFEPIEENIEIIKKISDLGHEIIFMSSRPKEHLDKFITFIKERKIVYKTIISDCNYSKKIIINDFSFADTYPSCESISVKTNSNLRNYFNHEV